MFEWDAGNLAEIGWHRLYPAEVEEIFADPFAVARPAASDRGEPRRGIIGMTAAGRLLVAVYTTRGNRYRIVTAFPASRRDERAYGKANQ